MPARSLRPPLPLLSLAALLAAAPALADDAPRLLEPRNRLVASTFTVLRYHPIGLDQQVTLAFRQRIGDSEDILFKSRFWSVGAMGAWNPANWSARVEAMVEPIAVFQLRAAYDTRGYFGVFGAQSSAPTVQTLDTSVAAIDASVGSYPATVHVFSAEPTLQIAFGPLAIRNTFAVEYADWNIRSGDTYVYDPGADLIRGSPGWMISNTLTVAYLGERFLAGALYQWHNPLGTAENLQVHQAGLIGTYTFFDRGAAHGWFNKPTIVALLFYNVSNRARLGFTPVVAFTTESDLLPAPAAVAPTP